MYEQKYIEKVPDGICQMNRVDTSEEESWIGYCGNWGLLLYSIEIFMRKIFLKLLV